MCGRVDGVGVQIKRKKMERGGEIQRKKERPKKSKAKDNAHGIYITRARETAKVSNLLL